MTILPLSLEGFKQYRPKAYGLAMLPEQLLHHLELNRLRLFFIERVSLARL